MMFPIEEITNWEIPSFQTSPYIINNIYIWSSYIEDDLPSGNQPWQWKIHQLSGKTPLI